MQLGKLSASTNLQSQGATCPIAGDATGW